MMPVTIWLDHAASPHTIIHLRLEPGWTWDNLFTAIECAQMMALDTPIAAVVVILDGDFAVPGGSMFLPDNLDRAHELLAMAVDLRVPLLVVNADTNARMSYDFLRTMNPRAVQRVYFTDTVAEAHQYIRQEQAPLPMSAC